MPLIRTTVSDPPGTGPRAAAELAAALRDGSPDQRWAAARAVADTAGGLAALAAALARETDPRVREAIFTGLVRIATPDSAAAVLPYLRVDDAGMRTGALDALRAMPDAVAPLLSRLLRDADADVRMLACEILRDLPAPAAMPLLGALLETETEGNVCGAAVDVLAEIGTPDAVPALERCAARFPDHPFLDFAIKIAADRCRARAAQPRA